MKLYPLNNRVIVKRLEAEETTSFGLILAPSAKDKPAQGYVVAVGSGAERPDGTRKPSEVKEGDLVMFGQHSGHPVKVDKEELLVLTELDIVAILAPLPQ
jgi:chaperonin GroES